MIILNPLDVTSCLGRGTEGSELTLCLRINILWSMGNPMPELTLTPPIVGFNSRYRTKNLGSVLQEELDCDAAL